MNSDEESSNPRVLAPLNEERKSTEKDIIDVRKLKKIGLPL